MSCNHEIRFHPNTKHIIAEPTCLCCMKNLQFIQTITKPNITKTEYDNALIEYNAPYCNIVTK